MKKPSVTFERFEIHAVEFPFSDQKRSKNRPALVISDQKYASQTGNVLLAMITSARNSSWPHDHEIVGWKAAGLPVPCIVRMKFATLATERLGPPRGQLQAADIDSVQASLRACLAL